MHIQLLLSLALPYILGWVKLILTSACLALVAGVALYDLLDFLLFTEDLVSCKDSRVMLLIYRLVFNVLRFYCSCFVGIRLRILPIGKISRRCVFVLLTDAFVALSGDHAYFTAGPWHVSNLHWITSYLMSDLKTRRRLHCMLIPQR